eukprot:SAG31_NODE_11231_length_1051_cov_1.225840_1_plen_309_part_01
MYHRLGPTIGFASQYAGSESLPDVLAAIAEWAGGSCPMVVEEAIAQARAASLHQKPADAARHESAAAWVHSVASCACKRQVEQRGADTACDLDWLQTGRRADGSWWADGHNPAELEWASPLKFKQGDAVGDVTESHPHSRTKKDSQKSRRGKKARRQLREKTRMASENEGHIAASIWVGFESPDEFNQYDRAWNGLYQPVSGESYFANKNGKFLYHSPVGKAWYFNTAYTPGKTTAFASLSVVAPPTPHTGFPPEGRLRWSLARPLRKAPREAPDWALGNVSLRIVYDKELTTATEHPQLQPEPDYIEL